MRVERCRERIAGCGSSRSSIRKDHVAGRDLAELPGDGGGGRDSEASAAVRGGVVRVGLGPRRRLRLFASRYAGHSPWDAARQLDLSERLLFGCRVRLSPDESVSRLRRRLHLYPCRILVATDPRLLLITPERASIKDGDTERQRVRLAAGDVRFEHDLPVPEGKALAAIVKRRTGPQDC